MQVTEFLKLGQIRDPKAASWGTNMILFTAKSDTAPLTKSLASQFEGKIAFGESRASNKVLGESSGNSPAVCSAVLFAVLVAYGKSIRMMGDIAASN